MRKGNRVAVMQPQPWSPPQTLQELCDYAPNLVSSIARNVLLELQQGRLHYGGQLEDLISELNKELADGKRLQAFNVHKYPKTPENGWKAFMVTVLKNLTKNWLSAKAQKFHFCPRISDDETQSNTVHERDLPPHIENPHTSLEHREINTQAELKMKRFIAFIEEKSGCSITSRAIELMSFEDMSLLQVQEALGLSDKERGILKLKTQELWYVFTASELAI